MAPLHKVLNKPTVSYAESVINETTGFIHVNESRGKEDILSIFNLEKFYRP